MNLASKIPPPPAPRIAAIGASLEAGAVPPRGWFRDLAVNFGAQRGLKAVIFTLFVPAFFAAYFHLLRHPVHPVTTMPLTVIDRWIGYSPLALVPYVSLWFYAFLAPSLLRERRELVIYCLGALTITFIGLGLFWLCPSEIPRPSGAGALARTDLLHRLDSAGNACPSLHVAFAVLTVIWLERLLRGAGAPGWTRVVNGVWCALIAYSTLGTEQHVAVDVLAGAALGLVGGLWRPDDRPGIPDRPHFLLNRQFQALALSVLGKALIPALDLWPDDPWISLLLFSGPDVFIFAGLLLPNRATLMPVATHFVTERREVWLTIDDGPDAATTRRMLELLRRHDARATFFVIGQKAAAERGVLTEVLAEGHTLGNHTQTHPLVTFWFTGPQRTAEEIDVCQAALPAAAAGATGWFRAPAGIRNFFLRRALARRGLTLVGWTARGREHFSSSPAGPLRRLARRLRPGAILLVHSSASVQRGEHSVALLSALLDHLQTQGYRCVLPGRESLR